MIVDDSKIVCVSPEEIVIIKESHKVFLKVCCEFLILFKGKVMLNLLICILLIELIIND